MRPQRARPFGRHCAHAYLAAAGGAHHQLCVAHGGAFSAAGVESGGGTRHRARERRLLEGLLAPLTSSARRGAQAPRGQAQHEEGTRSSKRASTTRASAARREQAQHEAARARQHEQHEHDEGERSAPLPRVHRELLALSKSTAQEEQVTLGAPAQPSALVASQGPLQPLLPPLYSRRSPSSLVSLNAPPPRQASS